MVERIRNVIKSDRKKGMEAPESEPVAKQSNLLGHYPMSFLEITENAESLQQHMNCLEAELSKTKPHDAILLPLMKSTFGKRRMLIVNDTQISVDEIIRKYPVLCHMAIVSCIASYRI